MSTLTRPERDIVSGLVIGYEADALLGIDRESQIERLLRWKAQGWGRSVYHYNILAVLIGYAHASTKSVTLQMPGFEGL